MPQFFLEIPALLYCVKGNSAEIRVGKFEKKIEFECSLLFFTLFLYIKPRVKDQ